MSSLLFSGAHVWVRVEGAEAVLGLSDYLHDEMGEITRLELADLGDVLQAGRRIGHDDPGELDELINEEEYAELTTEV